MSYTAFGYYVFVLILVVIYYLLPKKVRWVSLLAGSIFFYIQVISRKKQLAVFLFSIVVSYVTGLILEWMKAEEKGQVKKKAVLAAGILLTAAPFLTVKIGGFLSGSVFHAGTFSWIVPVGLSFYTLQLISYMADIYRGKITAQKNPLKFGLYASFFPQIIQGPIPRYEKLSKDLFDGNDYDYDRILSGIQLIIWGFFLKFMIADKSSVIVNTVFDNYRTYGGGYIWYAGILYSLQLYTDFLSCTTLSQGTAQLFGIRLSDNFARPYFAVSIKDFWRRWHISLSTWLRDYVYIPLGGNRHGKVRKWINILITFGVSGFWHGDSWRFLLWGLVHGMYQICGEIKDSALTALFGKPDRKKQGAGKVASQAVTFILVMTAWVIFRAGSLRDAVSMIRSMFTVFNPWIWFDESLLELGLEWKESLVLFLSIGVLAIVSYAQETGRQIRRWISEQNIAVRWAVFFLAIWAIWIFGSYGFGYDTKDFIYGGF